MDDTLHNALLSYCEERGLILLDQEALEGIGRAPDKTLIHRVKKCDVTHLVALALDSMATLSSIPRGARVHCDFTQGSDTIVCTIHLFCETPLHINLVPYEIIKQRCTGPGSTVRGIALKDIPPPQDKNRWELAVEDPIDVQRVVGIALGTINPGEWGEIELRY